MLMTTLIVSGWIDFSECGHLVCELQYLHGCLHAHQRAFCARVAFRGVGYIMSLDRLLKQYVLDENNKPVATSSMAEWGEFFRNTERRTVAKTDGVNGYDISTVFLGIDHNYSTEGPPILFETMVFGDDGDDVYCVRCSTWEEAEAQHAEAVQLVKNGRIEEESLDLDDPPYSPVAPEDMWTGRVAQIYIPVEFDKHGRKS